MPRSLTSDTDDFKVLRSELQINRDRLDEELVAHPHNFWHVGEAHARAIDVRDTAKFMLERTAAELDKDIRDNAVADGEKITEPQVKAQLIREPDYHKAQRDYLAACLDADRWKALLESYRQRGDVLRGMIQLANMRNYSDSFAPTERRDARERVGERRRGN